MFYICLRLICCYILTGFTSRDFWLWWLFWFKCSAPSEPKLSPTGNKPRQPQKMGQRAGPGPGPGSAWVNSDWRFVPNYQGKWFKPPQTNEIHLCTFGLFFRFWVIEWLTNKLEWFSFKVINYQRSWKIGKKDAVWGKMSLMNTHTPLHKNKHTSPFAELYMTINSFSFAVCVGKIFFHPISFTPPNPTILPFAQECHNLLHLIQKGLYRHTSTQHALF